MKGRGGGKKWEGRRMIRERKMRGGGRGKEMKTCREGQINSDFNLTSKSSKVISSWTDNIISSNAGLSYIPQCLRKYSIAA